MFWLGASHDKITCCFSITFMKLKNMLCCLALCARSPYIFVNSPHIRCDAFNLIKYKYLQNYRFIFLVCGQNIVTWKSRIRALHFTSGHKHALKIHCHGIPIVGMWLNDHWSWMGIEARKTSKLDFVLLSIFRYFIRVDSIKVFFYYAIRFQCGISGNGLKQHALWMFHVIMAWWMVGSKLVGRFRDREPMGIIFRNIFVRLVGCLKFGLSKFGLIQC